MQKAIFFQDYSDISDLFHSMNLEATVSDFTNDNGGEPDGNAYFILQSDLIAEFGEELTSTIEAGCRFKGIKIVDAYVSESEPENPIWWMGITSSDKYVFTK